MNRFFFSLALIVYLVSFNSSFAQSAHISSFLLTCPNQSSIVVQIEESPSRFELTQKYTSSFVANQSNILLDNGDLLAIKSGQYRLVSKDRDMLIQKSSEGDFELRGLNPGQPDFVCFGIAFD